MRGIATRFHIRNRETFPCTPLGVFWQKRQHPHYCHELPREVKPHHADAFVQFTLRGSGIVITDAMGEQMVPVGRCLVADHKDRLTYQAAPGGWEFVYIALAGPNARTWVKYLVEQYGHVQTCDLNHRFFEMLETYYTQRPGRIKLKSVSQAAVTRLCGELFAALLDWNTPASNSDQRLVEHAINFLKKDLKNPPTVQEVADRCGVSREHLTRTFTAEEGRSPAKWLREERLNHAALLLTSSSQTVSGIADAVGFGTPSTFVTAFRRSMGCTPLEYRKTH